MSSPTDPTLDSMPEPTEPGPEQTNRLFEVFPPDDASVEPDEDGGEWEFEEAGDTPGAETTAVAETGTAGPRLRRRRRRPRLDSPELRLRGRRALCPRVEDIAPLMLKTAKLRVLGGYLQSVRGLEDDDLTRILRDDAAKLADPERVRATLASHDPDYNRGQLKAMILAVLLQEETHTLPENRLDAKVIEFEKALAGRAAAFDLAALRKADPDRWHSLDTYRIVLDAAWSNDGQISPDEARLLTVLRKHLGIPLEEHWVISALIGRFPKTGGALHTPDEVNDARKDLQRQSVVWSYRDESNQLNDVIPAEVAPTCREWAGQELQVVNYRRLLSHDALLLPDLWAALDARGLDRSGNKPDLIARIVASDLRPTTVLGGLDRERLSSMCGTFGLKSSGAKAELIARIVEFYDDLTFEVRQTKDEREAWYSDYVALASRSYAELRAKKVITKDLDIEHLFEAATAFLFGVKLKATCDPSRTENRADGRVRLDADNCVLWDCKSVEAAVNLQDHLDGQFDSYLRKEQQVGLKPLGFLVIGPAFTPQSIRLANQYKARTNWDVALVQADALKHLADRWAATEPDKPFPVRLLVRTEVIDKERAEFLLSLA
ncbi:SAP domain-containing protein [Urbifossiella limnaea]|uniref:SAP domain protein n=1 Tax=Urbifossiella limnaea TaxID=2528023 RepID=A0A517Y115_9BACT|nr:SAP domain-containing protein [Urbifossiella limnaea]QDU23459.1 SAP domain protein [Urbifossiella limnaea]